HGDLLPRGGRVRRIVEHLLRHPVPVWVYKRLLPSDLGIFLARSASRGLRAGAADVNPQVVALLRTFAREALHQEALDLVILAHAHQAEHVRWETGTYINTGCWYRDR